MRARVTLLPVQQTITVGDEETILDAALRAGLNLPHSCRGGLCSSCRARVLSGQVRYRAGRPPGLMEQEEREGYALLCQALPAGAELTIEVREVRPAADVQVRHLPCRIEQLRALAPDVMAVSLRLPAVEQFAFAAGQHVDILLPNDRRRSFSIANPPHQAALLELHVQRVPHGEFSTQVFAATSLKALLRIKGPLGKFWFREESPRPAILVGEGIGYAPLRSMLRHLLERGDRRPLHLYWGAPTAAGLYEDETLRGWCERYENFRYTPVLPASPHDAQWSGRTGSVLAAVWEDHDNLQDFDVYAAGPPAMIAALQRELMAHGLPPAQWSGESFDWAPLMRRDLKSKDD